MGSCEIYPQTIQYSPNGRFVAVCGDGEYIIYTAMALRSKSFGSAQEFVWANDSSVYAIRDSNNMVKIFKNFKEDKAFKPEFGAEGIYGGVMLGMRSKHGLAFYNWDNTELIRRIEIQPKHIFWSDSGELVCIATHESFFVLHYRADRVTEAQESNEDKSQDGIEDAFEVLGEVQHVVKTGLWVGDCFIYTNSVNRLNYYVGGEIITISHMDKTMYLLGYIPKDSRLYLGDKELNIVSFSLLVSVLEYQTAVMRRDFSLADKILPTIPKEQRTRVAHFLEKQGFRKQALVVSTDPEHRFELAVQLGDLEVAHQMALEAQSEHKWKELAVIATTKSQFSLAQECLHQTQDYGGLLLLATATGNASMLDKLAEEAEMNSKANVTFLSYFLQGKLEKCLDVLIKTDRLPEAAFLARTHLPSQVSRVVKLWKESLLKVNQKAAYALADPCQYSNLFPGIQEAIAAEQYLKETCVRVRPAAEYPLVTPNEERNILDEHTGFGPKEDRIEPEMELENTEESSGIAAVTQTEPTEESDSEESKSEKEAISKSTSVLQGTLTEECVEEQQAKPSSTDAIDQEMETLNKTTAESEESEIFPKELGMEQSRPMEDIRSLVELNVQITPAADAEHTVCISESLSSRTETKKQTPTEASSEAVVPEATDTENLLFTVDTDVIPSETENTIISEELDADFVSSEIASIIHSAAAADETAVIKGLTSDSKPSAATAAEELATFDHDSVELAKNSALDTIIAQEPLPSQDPEHGKENATLQEKPEENLQPAKAEILVPTAEPSEEQADPEGETAGCEEEINLDFNELDLDTLDLEDIDTTDINLDDDFLNE
ncbi:coatomer subunit beta'-like [Thalassophryne amazonica]|uniref:coatomer subunit beta'-like n=1 Tax=Thalassophryne amazonica TaxID=390379 RepID=UPI001472657B|nr:coatomer subunit beta'-like [Thalassophryne amazonica]